MTAPAIRNHNCTAHCTSCDAHFTGLAPFDAHRVGGYCVDPSEAVFGDKSAPAKVIEAPECSCDSELATGFVVRCAHMGDDVLRLDDYTEDPPGKRFAVWRWSADAAFYYGDDYDEALAAFYEADQNLLRGAE